jgi:hypothetical protein
VLVLVLVLVLVPAPIDAMDLNLPVSYGLPVLPGCSRRHVCMVWAGTGCGKLASPVREETDGKDPAKGTSLAVDFI